MKHPINPPQSNIIQRFDGPAGEEYRLFIMACPHFQELEQIVGSAIAEKYRQCDTAGITVLEIGCGPGCTTDSIAIANPNAVITAVDNEPVMLKQATTALADLIRDGRVTLNQADALDFLKRQPNKSFDVFASGFTLHNFDAAYRRQVLEEIFRVLKNDGMFINADKYARDDSTEHQTDLQWQLEQFKKVYTTMNRTDLLSVWADHYLEDERPDKIMLEGQAVKQMTAIGFVDIKKVYRQRMEAVITARKP